MNKSYSRFLVVALVAAAAFAQTPAQTAKKTWTPPKTSWGDPDLQGVFSSDELIGVPFERPAKFGTRKYLTEEEFAERAKDVDDLASVHETGERPTKGFWANQRGVDAAAVPPQWLEFAPRASHASSLVVDPPDGRVPALTPEAKALQAAIAAKRGARPESWLDLTMYDRCITRGVAGSIFPVIYGNGTQIVQAPGIVAIRNEMIHETRIIPTDGRPHAPANQRMNMGDSRGHWEGNTLVVETTNYIGGRNSVSVNGTGGVPYSDDLKTVERFTRVDDKHIDYEMRISDPKTYTAPWTVAFTITQEPGYQIFEYACHEGNYGMPNRLSAARAEEAAEAVKSAK
jgi:hypothetical protein